MPNHWREELPLLIARTCAERPRSGHPDGTRRHRLIQGARCTTRRSYEPSRISYAVAAVSPLVASGAVHLVTLTVVSHIPHKIYSFKVQGFSRLCKSFSILWERNNVAQIYTKINVLIHY